MAAKNFGRVNVSVTASTGGLTAGLGRASKSLQGFKAGAQGMAGTLTTALAGFVGLGRGATIAAVGIKALGLAIKSLLGPLLILTSLVSIFTAIGRSAGSLDEASKTARRLGMSMSTFQTLGQVADEAGVSVEQMGTLLTFMSKNLGNLANGSKSAQTAFANIGLTFADLQGLKPEQQFALISQRIMALPTAAQRTTAAMAIFGRQGAASMGLIADVAGGAYTEIERLRKQLGLNLTDEQAKGIEMMNDALSRLSLLFQGFINQLLAGVAPAITTVANLFVRFFAESSSGFSIAQNMADGFTLRLRLVVGAVTAIYGAFQVLSSFVGVFIQGALKAFEGVTWALENMLSAMADAAESLPGYDMGIASGLRNAQQNVSALSSAAGDEAAVWGQAAAANFEAGLQNMSDPLAAFDAEFANVTAQMRQAGAAAGESLGQTAGAQVANAVRASSEALKAIVVGTGDGEAFRNSLMRGADPRLEGDKAAARTADATERTADGIEEMADGLAAVGGLGLATIAV